MNIYILQNGQETGPYSDKAARQLLAQGDVTGEDFACRAGMSKWISLNELLAAEPPAVAAVEAPKESKEKAEPATPKQKALLSYLSIALAADLSRDQAARLVNDAMEDPNNAERLTLWNEERLRLHPELFAAEIQTKKENRANHFFELCQSSGAKYFNEITKAHCQVLVGFLDVKFPNWDAREAEAAEQYFFPAVAEKFPQLVLKQWRGRLHYPDAMKVAPEIVHKSPTSKLRQSGTSAIVAVTRGLVLGAVILGALYLGYRTMHQDVTAAPADATAAVVAEKVPERAVAVAEPTPAPPAKKPRKLKVAAAAPEELPPIEPVAPLAQASSASSNLPPASVPAATVPATPLPPMTAGPNDAPPMAAADPAMAAAGTPAMATVPMAALPGTEPPVPVPPPPATLPTPGTLPPSATEPAVPPPAALPVTPSVPDSTPPTAVAKTNLVLTKPVEIQSTYGKIILPPGTAVKLVNRQGAALKVSYRNTVINVPVASTDLE